MTALPYYTFSAVWAKKASIERSLLKIISYRRRHNLKTKMLQNPLQLSLTGPKVAQLQDEIGFDARDSKLLEVLTLTTVELKE